MGKKKKHRESRVVIHKELSVRVLNRVAIALIFILPVIYFARFLTGTRMMYGSDWLLQGYPSMHFIANCIRHYGKAPLWNPNVFGGLPGSNPYNFYSLFNLILPAYVVWAYLFVFSVFLAGLGTYLYLKELKFSLYISFLGAIAYMGVGSVLSMPYAGHLPKTLAAALFPFILLFLHKGLLQHRLIYFLFAGAFGGFSATHAHFQLTYYAGIVFVFYFLFQIIWQRRENKLKGSLKLLEYSILGLILAIGLASIQYLPIFSGFGWGARGGIDRGYQFATSWSLPTSELLDLLTPHFSGILNNYWGQNYFKLDTRYLGILPILLSLIAILVKNREKYVKFFIGLGIVSTLFALGGHTPLYRIPYYLLPQVNKFRGPSMIFYLVAFSIIVLSAFGIQELIKNQKSKIKNQKYVRNLAIYLSAVFGITAIFAIICSVGRESMLSFLQSHFQPILSGEYVRNLTQQKLHSLMQNYPNFLGGLGFALFLVAVNSILIMLLAIRKLKLIPWTIITVGILIFDQWGIEKKFLKSVPPPKEYYAPDGVVNFLKGDRGIYRVFPLYYEHTTDSYLMLHSIQSVGGYVANPYYRYQDLIGAGTSVMFTPPNLVKYRNILDILNAKYVIDVWLPKDLSKYSKETQKKIENFKSDFKRKWGINWEDAHKGLGLVYKDRYGHALYENKTVLPRAWIVHNFKVLSKEKVLEELKSPDFEPGATVLIEEKPSIRREKREERKENFEEVKIIEYTPNKIVCNAKVEEPGFLVLSENWYPDWKAYVDGKETKVYIADYILRSVELNKGEHKIEFVYKSRLFEMGALISFFSFLFLLGTIGFWFVSRKHIHSKSGATTFKR